MGESGPARSAKEIVREGWNLASEIYRPDDAVRDVFGHTFQEHREWLAPLFGGLPPGARVLDLGCGCGVPDCSLLAERFDVLGVDLSDRQIERARRLVDRARFLRADMTELDFPAATFDAIICLYALIHIPLVEQRPLLERIRRWLAPEGWFIVVTGHDALEGFENDWLGSGGTMFWSHSDAATYRRWLEQAGFEVTDQRFIPESGSGHELFRARARS